MQNQPTLAQNQDPQPAAAQPLIIQETAQQPTNGSIQQQPVNQAPMQVPTIEQTVTTQPLQPTVSVTTAQPIVQDAPPQLMPQQIPQLKNRGGIKTAYGRDNPGRKLGIIGLSIGGTSLVLIALLMTIGFVSSMLAIKTDDLSAIIDTSLFVKILFPLAPPAGIILGIISYFQSKKTGKSRLPGKLSIIISLANYFIIAIISVFLYLIVIGILAAGSK